MTFAVVGEPVSVALDPSTSLLFEAAAFDRTPAGRR